jgi:hypothetical protein
MDNRITLAVIMLRKYRGFYTTSNQDTDPTKTFLRSMFESSNCRTLTVKEAEDVIGKIKALRGAS